MPPEKAEKTTIITRIAGGFGILTAIASETSIARTATTARRGPRTTDHAWLRRWPVTPVVVVGSSTMAGYRTRLRRPPRHCTTALTCWFGHPARGDRVETLA